ncbi:tRNA (adenosine(37)-N6)-threonylcarbamoyltransferase complex ATPase subunit type 1 TsaE [Mycoplasma zalophi]|uniref:tRNA (Adenosine(37)-N6)-threonylcarbamoyltransferase complex ATPase subunit type 1 TsaE n=1 Tax=Mycoplasma zalophi TaxID=191287 RepID=A0ABS6DPI3_9MOLU|nr:tRNA (adenosine(37)-N6)-threonylcarbamoyltransferase complex ATPase subunit type 1 TsaE [Mycoplasma zalophi]MBU4690992.1 tRNA (adenosine(37)-N6)-threonylcarbamoyltransferase complex ATPase subunit type 1 TsaE [Mycoplasma zalophi]MBU4692229.1 tRNA (adenosine(37)-N6)-threonylcarbamoyltransferase complex ATPase subunit type 1 TsaE [Mycoplasma zalophi]
MIFKYKENEQLDDLVQYLLSKKFEAILLNGELGAGKTYLTAQIASKLNISQKIISPTFNTIFVYDGLVHIDAYKLRGNLEAYEDYFENNLVIIEWSNNIEHPFNHYAKINVYLENDLHVFEIVEEK